MEIGKKNRQHSYKEAQTIFNETLNKLHNERRVLLDELKPRRLRIMRNDSRELKHWVSVTPCPQHADPYFKSVKIERDKLLSDGVFTALNESQESKKFHTLDRWGDKVIMSHAKGKEYDIDLKPKRRGGSVNHTSYGRNKKNPHKSNIFVDTIDSVIEIFF